MHLDKDIYDRAQAKDPSEMRANAFASAFLMPEDALRKATRTTGLTEDGFATLACDLKVTPSALAIRLQQLRLIDAGTCDRLRKLTAAKAASITGRSDEFARRVADASAARPPGLLVRDAYAAYEAGATTIRPYANLLGIDADELSQALEASDGAAGGLWPSTSTRPSEPGLTDAIRAGAAGIYSLEAACELAIGSGWLGRDDFTRFITVGTSLTDGVTELAHIDWHSVIASRDTGLLPCSNGENRVLRLAASIAAGISVNLNDALSGLDHTSISLVASAVLPANARGSDHTAF